MQFATVSEVNGIEATQQALTHVYGVLALNAHAQQDRQQFGVGQRLRAVFGQAFARALSGIQVSDAVSCGTFFYH